MSGSAEADGPYRVLGVRATASDQEVRSAYRRLVQLHHPDHNGGSPESAARFEAVQAAYAAVVTLRRGAGASRPADAPPPPSGPAARGEDPADVQRRLDKLERDLAQRRAEQARAARAAEHRRAAAAAKAAKAAAAAARPGANATGRRRPTDEELGYFSTDDSFSKILDDAAEELGERWQGSAKKPLSRRLTDLLRGPRG